MKKPLILSLALLLLAGCTTGNKTPVSSSEDPLGSSSFSAVTSSSQTVTSSETSSSQKSEEVSSAASSSSSAPTTSSSTRVSSSTPVSSSSSSPSSSSRPATSIPTVPTGDPEVDAYYNGISGSGKDLLSKLTTRMNKGFKSIGYEGLGEAYKTTDTLPDGHIHDYYSNATSYYPSDLNGDNSYEGASFNKEHSIPKSWWGGSKSNQGCDVYIVVPTDCYVNNRRSNYSFGETSGDIWKSKNGYCKLGASLLSGYTGTVFEPNDETKGDFARIYFYALTKWSSAPTWIGGNGASTFSNNYNVNFGLTDYALNLFLKWHQQDPVDDYEIRKNNAAVKLQGNRNPYVDHPEWVNAIWGGSYQETKPTSIQANATQSSVYVNETVGIHVTASPLGASSKATFRSLNPSIASVNDAGVVTGLNPGIATIEVTSAVVTSLKTTVEIEVKEPEEYPLDAIHLEDIVINEGKTAQIEVTNDPHYAYPRPNYTYVSNDESVATVSTTGLVKGVKEGTTTIKVTATQKDIVVEKTLTVTVRPHVGGVYTKATSTIEDGQYLLVCEKAGKALNANEVVDDKNNGVQTSVTINNDTIEGEYGDIAFTIKKEKTGYSIRTPKGDYVCADGKGSFVVDRCPAYNNITFKGTQVSIEFDGFYLMYNTSSSYFRYYGSSSSVGGTVSLFKAN